MAMTEGEFLAGGSCELSEAALRLAARYDLSVSESRQLVADGLRSGRVGATVVDVYGKRTLPQAGDFSDANLDFGEAEAGPAVSPEQPMLDGPAEDGGFYLALRIIGPSLEVQLPDLDEYARRALGRAAPTAAAKDRGGRPPIHQWNLAAVQAAARIYQFGTPSSKGELARELADWFAETFTASPELRSIERFVAEIWPALIGVAAGDCELRPRESGDET